MSTKRTSGEKTESKEYRVRKEMTPLLIQRKSLMSVVSYRWGKIRNQAFGKLYTPNNTDLLQSIDTSLTHSTTVQAMSFKNRLRRT